ncbi:MULTISPECIES: DUF4261 domain-containing protein [Bradyrhizobium]|jgi:hypothetical protein|uniref:DUF4261 domain-containing protein n=1 Tax=Bradyrhizobium TaxID=374 RepID=UPI000231C907|nr:DUF4261 domain-containing protein [Bradyrhizobium japonicum]AJA61925.1 hypothetical protein RN69_17425 [Bradyrhizobium japonicum]KMK00922.1 hypothetical protein CF64_01495 [Bradyrhizobium japonicum]MBR0730538.1 DUF4261 domain-containing protein [Bradyrhizobium japonicum]MBR0759643.1 DUF4261 domain-containing protein [Bradyrhizobium japonicum]MBR0806303.1 DUF4261 domain-containing protein [Bradyrhizobium japonicum]
MSKSFLALVLLETPATPDMVALAKAIRARHPELPMEVEGGGEGSARQGSPLIRCGNELVVVMAMPAPIPEDTGLWSRASTIWPQAKAVAAGHRGHLIVSVLGQNQRPLPTARLTTAVIGALIATMPQCCAVVWNGKVARSTDLWLDLSSRSLAPFPDYPCSLWIDILPFRSEAGIGAVTMGLAAFAEREIQFETHKLSLGTLLNKVDGLAAYLVEHGAVVKDGDTFGRDARERFSVRHKDSDQFGGLPVLFCSDGSA